MLRRVNGPMQTCLFMSVHVKYLNMPDELAHIQCYYALRGLLGKDDFLCLQTLLGNLECSALCHIFANSMSEVSLLHSFYNDKTRSRETN